MNQMLKIRHPKSIDLILMKMLSRQSKNQRGQSTLGFPLTISWPTPRMRCPIPTNTKVTIIRRNKFRCQFWNLGPSQKRKHTFDESTFIFTIVFSYLYLWINIKKIKWKIEVKNIKKLSDSSDDILDLFHGFFCPPEDNLWYNKNDPETPPDGLAHFGMNIPRQYE